MWAVFLALKFFLLQLSGHHVLIVTDNTAAVSYINHQGLLHSRPLFREAQLLLWAEGKFVSVSAMYIPGNVGENILSRPWLRLGDWRLHPQVVESVWRSFCQLLNIVWTGYYRSDDLLDWVHQYKSVIWNSAGTNVRAAGIENLSISSQIGEFISTVLQYTAVNTIVYLTKNYTLGYTENTRV